jgi:hypothetical protein
MNEEKREKVVTKESSITETPDEAFESLDGDAVRAGGAWVAPDGYEGSIGRTMFDLPTSKDGTVTILMPRENVDELPNQALIRIESLVDKRTYLGAVVEGPFAEPDGLRADSTPIIVSSVKGGLLMPPYHGRAQVEILGERLKEGGTIPPRRRPKPNSPIFALDAAETAKVLRLGGNLRLGMAEGFEDLPVAVPADSKSVFPRHLGILGTTGGGKSTTVSGLVAKAQEQKAAIVLIDTEGEYCSINEPTTDASMLQALSRRGLKPQGVKNTHVYSLVGRSASNPDHPSLSTYSLRFSELSPYAIQEILDLTAAQADRFFKAYDVTKFILEKLRVWPSNDDERRKLLELDEFETGYPKMTLGHLYDVVRTIEWILDKKPNDPPLDTSVLRNNLDELKKIINQANVPPNVFSWRALLGKLGKIKRLNIFDSSSADALDYAELVQAGRVSIIDLSDTDSTQINNLVIAELLRGVQTKQEESYAASVAAGEQPTTTLIMIEEAHEFLSAQKIQKMQVLFQQVARIARRGRKRWLGLVFITQLPQHLPDEVMGLINNWVLHKVSDAGVVSKLKKSIGGINEGLWLRLPTLAPGQAIVSFTTFTRPVQTSIDPTPCKLLMTE